MDGSSGHRNEGLSLSGPVTLILMKVYSTFLGKLLMFFILVFLSAKWE